PRECMSTSVLPAAAHTSAIRRSSRRADTSLTIVAPAEIAAYATSDFTVSTATRTDGHRLTSSSMTGRTRAVSSAIATGVAPGRVDSPPTSITSAPSPIIRAAWRIAWSNGKKLPPSLKLSRVMFSMPTMIGLRRRYLRSAEQRRAGGLGIWKRCRDRHRRSRRKRRRRAWRQCFTTRELLDFVTGQRFALEQRGSNRVQKVEVFRQDVSGALVRLANHLRDLCVDRLRRLAGDVTPALNLATQKQLLLIVADEDRPDDVGQSPLRYVSASDVGRLLNIARCARSHVLLSEHELLGGTTAVRLDECRLQLLASDGDSIVFRKREREPERTSARHDRDLVKRIVSLHLDRADRVTTFMVCRQLALGVLHHHRLALGAEHDLVLGIFEVDHVHLVMIASCSEQRAFVHEIGKVGTRHAWSSACEREDVDVIGNRLVAHVNAKDSLAAAQVRRVDDDLTIEAARAKQRRVQNVGAIGRRDQNHAFVGLEAVHLDEKLVERLLALVVPAAQACAAMASDRIDLVDEDDARSVSLALLEEIAHAARADADEHFDKVGTGHGEERTGGLTGHGAREQGLSCARRSDQQAALGQPAAELGELRRVFQELDDFLKFDLGLVRTRDVGEGDLGRISGEQLRLGFSEREGPVPARLHLAEQEYPESDQQEIREKSEDEAERRRARVFGVDLDVVVTETGDFFS